MCREERSTALAAPADEASERKMIDKAYGGDIIGVFDPGIFSIGDTLTTSKERFAYEGIPTFAPEHFAVCARSTQ